MAPQSPVFVTAMNAVRALVAGLVFAFGGTAAPAFAQQMVNGVDVDPSGIIRPALLSDALSAWAKNPEARRDRLAIVDFQRPSTVPRLYVVDMSTGRVESFLTAHGKGSDPEHTGKADAFSNEPGSNASSLGAFLATERYFGAHGLSLRLRGLDPSNDNAESRAIVVHSAAYMDPGFVREHGQPGRSFGCFAVESAVIGKVVNELEGGVMIFAGK